VAKWVLVVVVGVFTLVPSIAAAAPPSSDPGQTTTGTITYRGTDFPYLLYTPKAYKPHDAAPLLVMVHGCQTTAEQEMRVTGYNRLAEREGFVVLYPDVDATGRQLPGPLNQCWKFFDPTTYFRDNSDSAAIAAMTRTVMSSRKIDSERVYLVGASAGGLMTSAGAATYPDLYAAVGLVVSAGYADGPCFATGVGIPVTSSAQLAFTQMAQRARVVPVLGIGSDGDLAFPAACTVKGVEQGLRTSNLVLSGSQELPLALTPAEVAERQVPGGYGYTVSTFRDPFGCVVGERWIIHGMPHAWPGGTTDPSVKGYGDLKAPDGAEATWAFLQRYRKSDTGMPCAETRHRARSRDRSVKRRPYRSTGLTFR
jgi:poly(hydroxyalkanoate) depolymerase family esterase